MFNKKDFENISYINFDDDFSIEVNEKSKIIFGYNGIGKSSIYKYLKTKFNDYDFLDYENTKDSFLKNKKEVIIGAKIQTITKLKNEIEQLHENNAIETILKKYDYNSQTKARKINLNLLEIQKNKIITEFNINIEKVKRANEILNEDIKKKFFDNYNNIKGITNIDNEIEGIKNNYMQQAYSALINSTNDCETTCPACNTEGISDLKKRFAEKKKLYEASKKSIFVDFKIEEENREEKINELIEFAKSINDKELSELIICDANDQIAEKLKNNLKEIKTKQKEISALEAKLEEYYKNIKREEKDIRAYFENKFDIEKIEFNEENKNIKITFKRNVETYSEGEIHLIILLFKLYEFRINDSGVLIIDDPLTSYDLINQYKTLFEITNTVSENKKIIVFTHNIEMVNIINSQNRSVFSYQYIEKYQGKLYLKNIDLNESGSILSLKNLLTLDKDNYLKLLIEREKEENEDYHKVFHYDEPFTLNDSNFNNMSNDNLANIIEDFNENNIKNELFTINTFNKIIYMCAIRVWIEKKIYEKLRQDTNLQQYINLLKGKQFSEKVNKLFPVNKDSLLMMYFPDATRSFLMSKKVMLNQNEHYLSQIVPFNYALNISLDDLIMEIKEIKDKFN